MKKFHCKCGEQLFFENTTCLSCNHIVAYEFETDELHTLTSVADGVYQTQDQREYRLCQNATDYSVCNVAVPNDQQHPLCIACQLNHTIPNLSRQRNIAKWSKLEAAKRRLVRTLLRLGLSVLPKNIDQQSGLAFAFLEAQAQNSTVTNQVVSTGHAQGLITINLVETDDAMREHTRLAMGEMYRTVLGHLRHEVGHYYFDQLVANSEHITTFRSLFGDEGLDYEQSMQSFYAAKHTMSSHQDYISEYAQSHPLEDWAECWAHYLHMTDTLETGYEYGMMQTTNEQAGELKAQLLNWSELVVLLNELNRSLGLNDAYPFIYNEMIIKKLNFVHQVIDPTFRPTQQVAFG